MKQVDDIKSAGVQDKDRDITITLLFVSFILLILAFFVARAFFYELMSGNIEEIDGSIFVAASFSILFFALVLVWTPIIFIEKQYDRVEVVRNQTRATIGILILLTLLAGTAVLAQALKPQGQSSEGSAVSAPASARGGDAKCLRTMTLLACPAPAGE